MVEVLDVTGSGTLPEPHAELSPDGATVRLFYGSPVDPVLELAELAVAEGRAPVSRPTARRRRYGSSP